MNPEALFAKLRTASAALSRSQLITLGVAFVAVVGLVVGSAYWVNAPTYGILYTDLDPESAGQVVTKLKNDKVAYRLDDGGRTVRVETARLDELRLSFASQTGTGNGKIGFEIFDRTAFGVTDFLEHVNYRRALEGELARTIGTIAEVANARVHIAMPRPSLFASQDQAAKASVVLKLRTGRPLAPGTITAISGLVASSVEGLRPEAVVIMDTQGRPLAKVSDGGEEALGAQQFEKQQRTERDLAASVTALLQPIVGADGVRVNVSAKLSHDSQEETEERWDPTPVVRSHQSVNNGGPAFAGASGVAGAKANMPLDQTKSTPNGQQAANTIAPTGGAPTPGTVTHGSETTNYEVSRLTRHRVQPRGQVARLSVAVLLDDEKVTSKDAEGKTVHSSKKRDPKQVQKIHDIVAAAVGYDQSRGDQLTVENIAFEELVDDEPVKEPTWKKLVTPTSSPAGMDMARLLTTLLVVAFALFGVIRPIVKRTLGPAPAQAGDGPVLMSGTPKTIAEVEGEMGATAAELFDEGPSEAQSKRLPELTKRVAKLTQAQPENAARLVRAWLAEEER